MLYQKRKSMVHPSSLSSSSEEGRTPFSAAEDTSATLSSSEGALGRGRHSSIERRKSSLHTAIIVVVASLLLSSSPTIVSGHGYLLSPRSRNLVAYQDKNYQSPDGNDPKPEDCPHCLNRGGVRGQCGLLSGVHNNNPWERNYDSPLNIDGNPMSSNLQGVYREGQIIEVEVLVTTHHKGHFEFAVCPISDEVPMPVPTARCFEENKLIFVSDELYGAVPDPNYPERAYIAPASVVDYTESQEGVQPVVGAYYRMKFRLPRGVAGNVVLLQWYYLTANSCKHPGYADYSFPEAWGNDVKLYPGLSDCGEVPPDGAGVPEQFWNCAEIRVVGRGGYPAIGDDSSPAPPPSSSEATASMASSSSASQSLGGRVKLTSRPNARPCTRRQLDNNNNAGVAMQASSPRPPPSGNYNIGGMASIPCLEPRTPRPTMSPTMPRPTTSPTMPQPSTSPTPKPPCANAAKTYYEATDDCTGYYLCEAGQKGQQYGCNGNNMLYDDKKQMCNWADEVTCGAAEEAMDPMFDEDGNPLPTKSPTPPPVRRPNPLLQWEPAVRRHDKTMIAYFASWQWYDRNGLAEPKSFDWSKITRANFAFFQITETGYIYGTDPWADPITLFGMFDWQTEEPEHEYCSWDEPEYEPSCMAHHYEEGLIYLAHAAGAEVYPSLGGWSLSDPFPPMAANEEWRANFCEQCVRLIRAYNFDGIDLDWEYPGYEPHSGTPDDTINFNLLLDDLRAALDALGAETGRYYGITAALPCGPSIIDNQDIEHVGRLLTELNLMTYDFHGSWGEKTGVNAPLYDQDDSPEFSVHGCVINWLEGGAPKEKINIGFPFYGRSFLGAQHLHEPHEGNDDATWWSDEGVPQYYNIIDKWDEFTHVWDDQTKTAYAYSSKGMVSYDNERAICDKTEYAQFHGLNGYIIWEISGDLMPDLSTPLLDAANAKLLDPNMDCADLNMDVIHALVVEAHPPGSAAAAAVAVGATAAGVGAAGATGGMPKQVFYAAYDMGVCLNDGNEPNWLQEWDLFDTLDGCCEKHFSHKQETCVKDSPVTEPPEVESVALAASSSSRVNLYYPSATEVACLSDGNQPSWMTLGSLFATEEECCADRFPSQDCVSGAIEVKSSLYYPSSSGSHCLSDGYQPSWFPADSMFATEEECCANHFPLFENCIGKIIAMNHSRYYPSSTETACLSDGKQPSWLPANSMFATEAECCEHHFPNRDCVGRANEKKPLLFYPSDGECLKDGKQPSHISEDFMFQTQEECCQFHYEWKPDCITSDVAVVRPTLLGEAEFVQEAMPEPEVRPPKPLPKPPTKAPTHNPTTLRPTGHPTPLPTRQTSRPTHRRPPMVSTTMLVTPEPTKKPVASMAAFQNTPRPTRQTPSPTRQRPTNIGHPSSAHLTVWAQFTQPGHAMIVDQMPKPTKRPTRRPRKQTTQMPTPRPSSNSVSEVSSITSSFLGKPAYTIIYTPESVTVPVNSATTNKGQEQSLGDKISSQIQMQKMKATKQKMKKKTKKLQNKNKNKRKKNQLKRQKEKKKQNLKKRQKNKNQVKKKLRRGRMQQNQKKKQKNKTK